MSVLLTTHYMEEADQLCERVALLDHGEVMASGTPVELKRALGETATLEDVFREYTGRHLEDGGNLKDVRSARRTARRLG